MRHPHGISVTVRRTAYDPRTGDPLPQPAEHTIADCAFDPGGTRESTDLGTQITTTPTLYAPYDADLRSDDQILIPDDDQPWEVAGDVARWANPYTGNRPGCVVELTRHRGA